GVTAIAPLSADFVTEQIEAVAADLHVRATKVGMLATAAIVEAVAAAIEELDLPLVVVDPVMASFTGERLLEPEAVQALRSELLPLARVVTPNLPEAEALSGMRIGSLADARDAARRIQDLGPRAVIITGGHRPTGNPVSAVIDPVTDLVLDGDEWHEFAVARDASPRAWRATGASPMRRATPSSTSPAPSGMRSRSGADGCR